MIARYPHKDAIWVDLCEPSAEEVRALMDEYDLPPHFVEDLTSPTRRAQVAEAPEALKLTLTFPVVKLSERDHPQEIKFIITKKALITARYADIAPLHQFAKEFEVLTTLGKTKKTLNGGNFFISMMHALYGTLAQRLEYIEARFDDIEEGMFQEREKEMVVEISRVGQRLVAFRQTLLSHEPVLAEARHRLSKIFGSDFEEDVAELESVFQHLTRFLSSLAAVLVELRETNNSLLTTKQNEIMKSLTIMALVTFPLTLLSSIFGMNTQTLPIVGIRGDFWVIIGIMAAATMILFAFFRQKGWM